MIALALWASIFQEEPDRTPSIFRCPAIEADSKFFEKAVGELSFDTYCVDPRPGAGARAIAKGRVKFIPPSKIDTKANLRWRDATVDFANGKISPRQWLNKTSGLKESVHFLSSPNTERLWEATAEDAPKAVFAEMLVTAWPGIPCFTSDDIGRTRYLPGPGRLESWILAMNDYLGPQLYGRHKDPFLVTQKPKIIRADSKPGLLIFCQSKGNRSLTFYLNNAKASLELPPLDLEKATIRLGVDIEGPNPKLQSNGFLIVESDG